MPFIEKYLIEPFKYVKSNWFKVLIGVLLLWSMLGIIFLLFLLFGPFALILVFIPLIFIGVIFSGYYIGVIKNTLKGLDTLPNWSNFIEIVKDGVVYNIAVIILVLLVYLPAILLLIIGILSTGIIVGGSIPSLENNFTQGDFWAIIMSLLVYIVVLLLYILIVSILLKIYVPLATVNFAKKGFFGFFKFSDVLKKISFEYILILLLYFVINFIFKFILEMIISITAPITNVFFIVMVLICIACDTTISFIFEIMSFRAIAKYYLEREREQ